MILDEIVNDKKKRLVEHKQKISEKEMIRMAEESKRVSISFYKALAKEGLSIIGEFKKASPSMGNIESKINLTDRISQYEKSVDAISCLTEEDHFHGNIGYLTEIRGMTGIPVLRKDFIIDPYQIYEAKVAGADAVLLIAAILNDEQLKGYYELAHQYGLDVLMEVHDEEEMDRAIMAGADIIGVNNRNLKDFTISLDTTRRLSSYLDQKISGKRPVFVSESGVMKEEDISFLKQCNVDALLIGRAFMEHENPEVLANHWKSIYLMC